MSNETKMTPAEVLDELVEAAKAFATCPNPSDPQTPDEWMAQSKWRDARDRLRAARAAVEALIAERDALLEKVQVARDLAHSWRNFERSYDRSIQDATDCSDDLLAAIDAVRSNEST